MMEGLHKIDEMKKSGLLDQLKDENFYQAEGSNEDLLNHEELDNWVDQILGIKEDEI